MRVVALTLLASQVAHADPRALFAEGQKLYAKGEYAAAAEKFELAFDEDPDPAYVFNVGQAHRLAKNCARAAIAYRKFLELVPDGPSADEVRGYEREVAACSPAPPPKPVVIKRAKPPPIVAPEPAVANVRSYSTPGIAIGIGGLVLIGVGVGAAIYAGNRARDRETVCLAVDGCIWTEATDRDAAALDRRGGRASAVSVTAIAAGGVAIATGVVLNIFGRRKAREPRITVTPAGRGVVVQGNF